MRKYIKSVINDDYAMEVLYYSLRKTIADNGFSLERVTSITISDLFIDEPVSINVNHRFSNRSETFALLLSVRALMLDKSLIDSCRTDFLLFEDYTSRKFEWVVYATIISNCCYDNDFKEILYILENVYYNESISDEIKKKFLSDTTIPEYRNIYHHYRKIASKIKGVYSEVICNNAFVLDETISEYDVPEDVVYIGDTAFAYCLNLKEIRLHRENVMFGKFPIVECDNLARIMVPVGSEEYYKNALPYYSKIIFSESTINEQNCIEEKVHAALEQEIKETIDDLEIEHMHYDEESSQYVYENDLYAKQIVQDPPAKKSIDTQKLKHVFDKKATSYKYFWFLSIISLLKDKKNLSISFRDLVIRMASEAWPMVYYDKINLGRIDMMSKYLNEIKKKSNLNDISLSKSVENWLHNNWFNVAQILQPLLKNVPYRFLSPWIPYVSNEEVIEKSKQISFQTLYSIHKDVIVLDEDWAEYIIDHYDDVYKFTIDSLVDYLKKHNEGFALLGFMSRIS